MASKALKQQLRKDYARALKPSPKWVKLAFHVYLTMPDKMIRDKAFLYFLLGFGKGTPPFKMTKQMSEYGESKVKGENCGNCRFAYQKVVNDKYICSQIRGEIEPKLWCRLHEGESSKFKGDDYLDDRVHTRRKEWNIEFNGVRFDEDNAQFRQEVGNNETVFRNILKDIKSSRGTNPNPTYFPRDINTDAPLGEIFEKYVEGDRHGKPSLTGFEMIDPSTAHLSFADVATLSGGGVTLEYKVDKDGNVKYVKEVLVFMS